MSRETRNQQGVRPRPLIAALLAAGACTHLAAQEGEPTTDPLLRELMRRNAELEQRVERLENNPGNRDTEDTQDFDDEGWDEELTDEDWGLVVRYGDAVASFQLFGDVDFQWDNPVPMGQGNSSFGLGTVDFFANVQVGEHFRLLSETVLNTNTSGMTNVVQMRLWGMWEFSDALYAKFGTEHSRVSRWNQLYHHGRYLELSIRRPLLTRFEAAGGILPVHHTGLELGGVVHPSFGDLEYWGAISNGRGPTPANRNTSRDYNDDKRYDLGLAFLPACLPDLRVGGSFTHDVIPPDPTSPSPERVLGMQELIAATHVELLAGDWEFFGEWAWIGHESRVSGMDYDSHAGFVQAACTFGSWTPYTRFDFRNMAQGDPFFISGNRDLDTWLQIFGVRHELAQNVALKFEFGFGEEDARTGLSVSERDTLTAGIQLSWSL